MQQSQRCCCTQGGAVASECFLSPNAVQSESNGTRPQLQLLSHYTGEAVTCCGLAAVKCTCRYRGRARTGQGYSRSLCGAHLTYSPQPHTIWMVCGGLGFLHSCSFHHTRLGKKKRFIFRPFNFCCWHTLSSAAPAWRVSQVFLHGEFWQLVQSKHW